MICDGEKPVALAGVMGGLNSEIAETTTRVLIESAYFNPACIRKTSKKTGLSTDAAYRFERGIDPEGVIFALNRAAALITDLGNGNLVDGVIDEYPLPVPAKLGTSLKLDEIKTYLESIDINVTVINDDTLTIIPPTFRVDIERPEDLSEEVARLWGYSKIQTTFPPIPAEAFELASGIRLKNQVKSILTGLGFNEAIHYSFIHRQATAFLRLPDNDPRLDLIGILNPLSEDQSVMRTSLVPGMLQTVQYNNARQVKNVMLFEIGKVFYKSPGNILSDEVEMLVGVMSGNRLDSTWYSKETPCDFFDLKGVLESFLNALFIKDIRFSVLPETDCLYTRKGYSATLFSNDTPIGIMGKVHQEVLDCFDIRQDVFVFEINLKDLAPLVTDERNAAPIARFPSVSRDTTIICENRVMAGDILAMIKNMKEDVVEHVELLDLYTGDPIPDGKKSLSFRMTYRDRDKTLKDKDVNRVHTKITQMLLYHFNAALPG
jgi:phenylalanyl-tRNA synthetase beta chain